MKIKTLLAALLLTAAAMPAGAGRPSSFRMQTIVTDNAIALKQSEVDVRIAIRIGSAEAKDIYVETHTVSTDDLGIATLNVGDGEAVSGTWDSIDWSKQPVYVAVAFDKGSGYVDAGCSQITAVPYAKFAEKSGLLIMTSASGKKFVVTIDDEGNLISKPVGQ